jgi:circadian clock protein KaiC
VLISGTAGSGKSSVAAAFVDSTCRKGGRCLYWSSEESPSQITRNMKSIGYDIGRHVTKGLLRIYSVRPTVCGLESHLVNLHKMVVDFKPDAVVMDPVTNLVAVGNDAEIKGMLTRVIDFLKNQAVTTLFTSLTAGGSAMEQSEVGISSLMDTWLLLSMVQSASERNRVLYLLKSRGMAHSNQMREFVLSDKGINLVDVYTGAGSVFTGTARMNQEAMDKAQALTQQQAAERRQRELTHDRHSLESQLEALKSKLANVTAELKVAAGQDKERKEVAGRGRQQLSKARSAD